MSDHFAVFIDDIFVKRLRIKRDGVWNIPLQADGIQRRAEARVRVRTIILSRAIQSVDF